MQNCITLRCNKSQKSTNQMELVQDSPQRRRYTESSRSILLFWQIQRLASHSAAPLPIRHCRLMLFPFSLHAAVTAAAPCQSICRSPIESPLPPILFSFLIWQFTSYPP